MRRIQKISLAELCRFGVGGGSAVLTDFVGYLVLKNMTDVSVAKGISFVLGSIVGFVINKLWTFGSRRFSWQEIFRYIALYAVSATVNTAVNKGVLNISRSTLLSFLVATGVSTVMNFVGQKFFVFRKRTQKEES